MLVVIEFGEFLYALLMLIKQFNRHVNQYESVKLIRLPRYVKLISFSQCYLYMKGYISFQLWLYRSLAIRCAGSFTTYCIQLLITISFSFFSSQQVRGMATLKMISIRLKSVKNIQKITQSMKMVSAAKYTKAERELKLARPYGIGSQEFYKKAEVKGI